MSITNIARSPEEIGAPLDLQFPAPFANSSLDPVIAVTLTPPASTTIAFLGPSTPPILSAITSFLLGPPLTMPLTTFSGKADSPAPNTSFDVSTESITMSNNITPITTTIKTTSTVIIEAGKDSHQNLGMVIGAVISAIVFILVLLGGSFFFFRRRKMRREQRSLPVQSDESASSKGIIHGVLSTTDRSIMANPSFRDSVVAQYSRLSSADINSRRSRIRSDDGSTHNCCSSVGTNTSVVDRTGTIPKSMESTSTSSTTSLSNTGSYSEKWHADGDIHFGKGTLVYDHGTSSE